MSDEKTVERGNVTVRGELDLTDDNQPSVFGQGETVEASTDDDNGDENTDVWPAALDRDDWTEKQQNIIEALATFPDASNTTIADYGDASTNYPHRIKNHIRCYVTPDEVNFDLPDKPKRSQVSEESWRKYQEREGDVEGNTDRVSAEKICRLYYDEGLDQHEIADRCGISMPQVRGSLAYRTRHGEDAEDNDQTEDGKPADKSQTERVTANSDRLACSQCGVGYETFDKWTFCPRCGTELTYVQMVSPEDTDD
jgi:transposase